MFPYFGQRVTGRRVRIQGRMVLVCIPFLERWELLRDSLEETDNHANRSRLHVIAELVNDSSILENYQIRVLAGEAVDSPECGICNRIASLPKQKAIYTRA